MTLKKLTLPELLKNSCSKFSKVIFRILSQAEKELTKIYITKLYLLLTTYFI